MTPGDEMHSASAIGPAPNCCTEADFVRYAAAMAAADDPETVMKTGEEAFRDMARLLTLHCDRVAAAGAAIVVQDAALRFCIAPAESEKAANDRSRFLTILLDWLWPRAPAVASAVETCCRSDRALWGGDIGRAD